MIIADPRLQTAGQASPRVVQYFDLYPTLVYLCGLPAPSLAGAYSDDADQSIRSDADQFGGKQRRAFLV